MSTVRLYHVGFQKIEKPDIRHGRRNADFGQGFYLSEDESFVKRWAKERSGSDTVLNAYEPETDGLKVKRFDRDAEWFDYIFKNRAGYRDTLSEVDVIVGPIANDTLYDTWGIITSGLLDSGLALELLQIGGEYRQTVIKTERAAAGLRFLSAEVMSSAEIAAYRETVRREEKEFQAQFAARLSREEEA